MLGREDYRGLARLLESQGEAALVETVGGWLAKGEAKPTDFSVRRLFEATVPDGRELLEEFGTGGLSGGTHAALMESGGAVKSTAFSRITGQIVYTQTKQYFELPEFVFTREVNEFTSNELGLEKIAGVTPIGDEAQVVDEAQPYPYAGVGQDWQELPPALKRGTIVALTWEAIFSDRTGMLLQQAGDVGRWMGQNKEKRIIDAICDENTGAKSAAAGGHRYHWRGTSYATYQTSASSAPYYANVQTSNAMVDWTDLQAAELVFMAIKHPYTNEPMSFTPTAIVCVPTLRYVADYIMSMAALHLAVGGYATSGNLSTLVTQAPTGRYRVLSSQLLADQMATDTDWYLADLKRAVGYKTCRPLTVEQAPAGHPDQFNRDVMQQWKVSEIGAACVLEPRAIVESRA